MATDEQYRKAARRLHDEPGDVEIDDDAPVERAGDGDVVWGAYVQAWVWVDFEEVESNGR